MDWVAIDVHIAGNAVTHRLAEAFRLRVAEAAGLLTLTYAGMAEHAMDGNLADVTNSQIEARAHWHGKRGALAQFVRANLCDESGTVNEWEEYNGANMREAEASRERSKRWREAKRKEKEERELLALQQAEGTPNRTAFGTHTERVANASTRQDKTVQEKRAVERDGNSGAGNAAPPASASARSALPELPPAALEFGKTFYAGADAARRADVLAQLHATLADGATLNGNAKRIRAQSPARLEAKCREVMAAPPKKRDAAIVILLLKLADTSDGSAPGHVAEATAAVSRTKDERTGAQRTAAAEAWLVDRPDVEAEITAQLRQDGHTDPKDPTRKILRRAALLLRWEAACAPLNAVEPEPANA
jgi:hypothetical protein